ncbi:four helix bundle protein [Pseudochryseolinea flava]|uniref:Four helix bundle protein n=1 Tax=Pseudochryseolinea flava TaxID=2059302 RepID=A0A364Y0V9_9BACT|nr:four helix bundle protein [Pseudochryseolinea flava]RAW00248.1 four helix bundle protein [Pseudochryseolinea flava]
MISRLEDFRAYNCAMELGENVWQVVTKWKYFDKSTIGQQLVTAVDSVAANLSEGLGRYHFRETKNLTYYSRGSLFETKTWLTKAHTRQLISDDQFVKFIETIELLGKMINSYIKTLGNFKESSLNDRTIEPYT